MKLFSVGSCWTEKECLKNWKNSGDLLDGFLKGLSGNETKTLKEKKKIIRRAMNSLTAATDDRADPCQEGEEKEAIDNIMKIIINNNKDNLSSTFQAILDGSDKDAKNIKECVERQVMDHAKKVSWFEKLPLKEGETLRARSWSWPAWPPALDVVFGTGGTGGDDAFTISEEFDKLKDEYDEDAGAQDNILQKVKDFINAFKKTIRERPNLKYVLPFMKLKKEFEDLKEEIQNRKLLTKNSKEVNAARERAQNEIMSNRAKVKIKINKGGARRRRTHKKQKKKKRKSRKR